MSRLIYVAGPYTNPDPVENTAKAIDAAEHLITKGWVPHIPHLNLLWELRSHHEPAFWYAYDFEILERCNAIVRLPGASQGADVEVEFAADRNLVVYVGLDEVPDISRTNYAWRPRS